MKTAGENGSNTLRMNFRGASLDMVLNHLSEAAGFIINVKPPSNYVGPGKVFGLDGDADAGALQRVE